MRSRVPHLTGLATVALPFVVLLVCVLVAGGAPLGMDRWWADTLETIDTPVLTRISMLVSDLGGGLIGAVVVPLLVVGLLWRCRSARAAVTFGLASAISFVLVQVVKHVVARPRPAGGLTMTDFGSFPSGHVANAATLGVSLLLLLGHRPLVTVAVGWPVAMALSRTALDVHWLSDTMAGASLGTLVALVTPPLVGRWTKWHVRRLDLDGGAPGPVGPDRDHPTSDSAAALPAVGTRLGCPA